MLKLIFFGQFLLFGIALFGIGLHYRYLRMMRLSHPATWQSLGRPTPFPTGAALMMSFRVLRFLWRREYDTIDDRKFSRLSDLVRTYNFLFVCLFCGFALLVLLFQTHVFLTI